MPRLYRSVCQQLVIFFAGSVLAALAGMVPASAQDLATRILGTGTVSDQPVVTVVAERADGIELEFNLPSLVVADLPAAGQVFQAVAIPGGGDGGSPGQPGVPTFSRFLALPAGTGVSVRAEIEDEEELSGYRLMPVQADSGAFAYDPVAYARDSFGTDEPARVGAPSVLRDLRVVRLTFAPVRYNPLQGKLRVARRMHVSVTYAGTDPRNASAGKPRPVATSFAQLYKSLVINDPVQERDVHPGAWLVICPDDSAVIQRLQPLLTWRQRKGLVTTLATLTQTGSTADQVKAYIQAAYDNWTTPLEYVVLAGDASNPYNIPTFFENMSGYGGEGDNPYTLLAGDDPLSDVHLGRLSYSSLAELETIVAKTVGYESTPYVQDSFWFKRACLVGDAGGSGVSTIMVMQWIKSRLRTMGYSPIDTVFGGSFVEQMTTSLNHGATLFAYRGYLGMSGWGNGNCYTLTNSWRMPFTVISTCGTGSFASETSISEAFVRAGTASAPKGAIASTGTATWGTHTRFNNCYIYGAYAGLLYEQQYTVGAAHTRGKYELYLNYWDSEEANYVQIFSHWNNLIGDPAVEVWTGYPAPLSVNAPVGVDVGDNSVRLDVTESGFPTAGAQVCLWKGTETFAVGRTDAQGHCELAVALPTAGNLLLTVSKHDRRPYLATLPVTGAALSVAYLGSSIDDGSTSPADGNGDGQVNPGETIALGVQLQNFGTDPAPAVTAVLSSEDPAVTVLGSAASFGDIAGGASASGQVPFVFQVDPGCPHGRTLRFSLDIASGTSTWHSLVDLPVVSVDLAFDQAHVDLLGNGVLDRGETAPLAVQVTNRGGLDADNPVATLYSRSSFVDVPFSTVSFPPIPAGGTAENTAQRFSVHARSDAYRGATAQMMLVLQTGAGVVDTVYFPLTVGTRGTVDPCGPDTYGYYAFDNTDVGYPDRPAYFWVEIDPTYGGSGTEVALGDYGDDQDKSRAVDMPFPFRYYGVESTRATICSNGWIVMGDSYLREYRNWTIPSGGGPDGIIAAFWDDLYQSGGGRVLQKYDVAGHKWIVEWSRMVNAVQLLPETFEIILYDPAYYPTDTGDGIIEFQYHTVNNVDATDGYATVGIEKPDHTDGLLYTYFNNYEPGAAILAAGRCIRLVPKAGDAAAALPDAEAPVTAPFGLGPGTPNPLQPGQSVCFALERAGEADLSIYDVQGRLVRRLFSGRAGAGVHAVAWDGTDGAGRSLPSGLYVCRLSSPAGTDSRKILLAR